MSSRTPTEVTFSLAEFARHGGQTGPHRDGWGIAWFEERDVRLMKEPGCASRSPGIEFANSQHLRSDLVIAHLRLATTGRIALRNTQPFTRELGGRMHAFAHNGDVLAVFGAPDFALDGRQPVGETDSEHAFCALLGALEKLWPGRALPPLEHRLERVAAFATRLAALGPANLLYSDGTTLFAFSDLRRSWPWQPLAPPGLHVLSRHCVEPGAPPLAADGVHVAGQDARQHVTLVASVPLTDEDWQPLPRGTLLAIEQGQVVAERHLQGLPSPAIRNLTARSPEVR